MLSCLFWMERLFSREFRAGVLTSTRLTTPAVLNEFSGDYTHGYFGNGLSQRYQS